MDWKDREKAAVQENPTQLVQNGRMPMTAAVKETLHSWIGRIDRKLCRRTLHSRTDESKRVDGGVRVSLDCTCMFGYVWL